MNFICWWRSHDWLTWLKSYMQPGTEFRICRRCGKREYRKWQEETHDTLEKSSTSIPMAIARIGRLLGSDQGQQLNKALREDLMALHVAASGLSDAKIEIARLEEKIKKLEEKI